ncbi:hypothetical protein HK097_006827, partial [Rhizophlyctis rosea]
ANPFGAAAQPLGAQLTGDTNRLVSSNATIDPFASLAATRSLGAGSAIPSSTGGQFNPFGGSSGQTSGAANNDPFAALAVNRQNTVSQHNTGGDFGAFGSPRPAISTHNTGPASFGGFGGMGSNHPISTHNTGGPFGGGAGSTPFGNAGGPANDFLGLGNTTTTKPANALVNLDLLGSSNTGGQSSNNGGFGQAANKNPFQTGGAGGNKFQWEQPKQQPTLAQL